MARRMTPAIIIINNSPAAISEKGEGALDMITHRTKNTTPTPIKIANTVSNPLMPSFTSFIQVALNSKKYVT